MNDLEFAKISCKTIELNCDKCNDLFEMELKEFDETFKNVNGINKQVKPWHCENCKHIN